MYVPPAFEENDHDVLWSMVEAQPLGLLISSTNGELNANFIPFEVRRVGDTVKLLAHLARANGQWQSLNGENVLVVFQGANAFITPRWYASKQEHGRVVPTWNYVVVQVRGLARVIEDRDWLLQQVSRLTHHHEQTVTHGELWAVADAPAEFIQAQLKGIVGLEIDVTHIVGKVKASQNRSAEDRAGVARGLVEQGGDAARAMSAMVAAAKA